MLQQINGFSCHGSAFNQGLFVRERVLAIHFVFLCIGWTTTTVIMYLSVCIPQHARNCLCVSVQDRILSMVLDKDSDVAVEVLKLLLLIQQ